MAFALPIEPYTWPPTYSPGPYANFDMVMVDPDGIWRVYDPAYHDCEWCHGTGRIVGWRPEPEYIGWVQTHPDAVPDWVDDDRRPEEADGEAREGALERWLANIVDMNIGIVIAGSLTKDPLRCSILSAHPDLRERALADAGYFAPPQDRGRGFIESGAIVFD